MSTELEVFEGNEKFVNAKHSIREHAIVSAILTETEVAQRGMLTAAIVIRKNLMETKTLVKHGEWENVA